MAKQEMLERLRVLESKESKTQKEENERKALIMMLANNEEGKYTNLEYRNKYNGINDYDDIMMPSWNWDYYDYRLKQEMTREEILQKFIKDNDLDIGSEVRVVKKFECDEWNGWNKDMEVLIGQKAKIKKILDDVIVIESKNHCCCVLPESLKKYVPEYVPFTYDDDILGLKVVNKNGDRSLITKQFRDGKEIKTDCMVCSYRYLFEHYTLLDGKTPAGKLKE